MKKIISCLALCILLNACKKEFRDSDKQVQPQQENQLKPQPPPGNANPVFVFQDYYQVNGNRSVQAIFAMDVTGANKTKIYSNYTPQTAQYPDYPAWSEDGTQICFTLNNADLYTLSVSLVNGYPVGSNPAKIGDGVAGGGSYKQGKWRPGFSQIACVWKKTGDPDKIHLLAATGGTATVLYTAASTDCVIEDDLALKSDGSNLVFSERQIPTGFVFLKVLDIATGQVIKIIDLSQYKSIREMDWAKSAGSSTVAVTTVPRCDTTVIGRNGIHQLQTVDVSAETPSLTWERNDAGNISWSPNGEQITIPSGLWRVWSVNPPVCGSSGYNGMEIFTFATKKTSIIGGGNHCDWKR